MEERRREKEEEEKENTHANAEQLAARLGKFVIILGKEEKEEEEEEKGEGSEGHRSPKEKRARILKRLRRRRVGFEELCVTNILSLFSVTEPQSNYFALRRWANNLHASDFICNVFHEQPGILRSARPARLSAPGRRMYDSPNAGGNSLWSEVMSYELLRGLYGAQLVRTEMEILYGCHSKITDYSILLFGHHIGVSVTRAMKFQGIFCEEDAFALLRKKLNGVVKSTQGVVREHRWEKQILHVWAECDYVADVVRRAYVAVEEEYKGNTLLLCTVARDTPALF